MRGRRQRIVDRNPGRGLRRQNPVELLEDQLLLRLGLSVAGENQFAAIGGGKVNVEQLHGRQAVERAARSEAGCARFELHHQRDLQAVGEEGDKDMRFDTIYALVVDRSNGEIALERFECGFDLGELKIKLPQLCGIGRREIEHGNEAMIGNYVKNQGNEYNKLYSDYQLALF